MEGRFHEQESIDATRAVARIRLLRVIRDFEELVRSDEAMGGPGASLIALLAQRLLQEMRIYRMAVNVGRHAELSAWMAAVDYEHEGRGP